MPTEYRAISSYKKWLLSLAVLLVNPLTVGAADNTLIGCADTGPVLDVAWGSPYVWRLPIAPDRPKVLTEARLSVQLQEPLGPGRPWTAVVRGYFPDPKPFGIPYSFEKLVVTWKGEPTAPQAEALVDWSGECTGPGRSLFPGKQWTQEVDLPGTENLTGLDQVQLRLWGSRN